MFGLQIKYEITRKSASERAVEKDIKQTSVALGVLEKKGRNDRPHALALFFSDMCALYLQTAMMRALVAGLNQV